MRLGEKSGQTLLFEEKRTNGKKTAHDQNEGSEASVGQWNYEYAIENGILYGVKPLSKTQKMPEILKFFHRVIKRAPIPSDALGISTCQEFESFKYLNC